MSWEAFVIQHGSRARGDHLAWILQQPERDILRLRTRSVCVPAAPGKAKRFADLFTLWHGRAPRDDEWPLPRRVPHGQYEWLGPELSLLASLVGRMGVREIVPILTERLRRQTGDETAVRNFNSVQLAINRIGLQAGDVVGGITVPAAAKEIGSRMSVYQAIQSKALRARRIGKLWLIPHAEWARWKSARVIPPAGYVPLATLREPLGIRSDSKLPEYASAGYIPTAVRCNPCGVDVGSSRFGTWYVAPEVAQQILDDRRAGRPMPWFGKPTESNLKATWKLLQARRHPPECETCRTIWSAAGAPATYEDYVLRYPPLPLGAKKHLTRVWSPGLTIAEVAREAHCSVSQVQRAIENGALTPQKIHGRYYVTRTNCTRWLTRRCPSGAGAASWWSLDVAQKRHGFTEAELQAFIADGRLKSKIGTNGPMRNVVYVSRQQCAELRAEIGYPEAEAAQRAGVTVERLRELMVELRWRREDAIPMQAIQAVVKRRQSAEGYSLEEAAAAVGKPLAWVHGRIQDGTVRVSCVKWDASRRYLTAPMLARLQHAVTNPPQEELPAAWLRSGAAAELAGVSVGTLNKWAEAGEVTRQWAAGGWRYYRPSVEKRARIYWPVVRYARAQPPAWLAAEESAGIPW